MRTFLGIEVLVLVLALVIRSSAETIEAAPRRNRHDTAWRVAESANFRVWSTANQVELQQFANRCEELCQELGSRWMGKSYAPNWRFKCEVILHSDRPSYLNAVGQASAGSTLIELQGAGIRSRRMDILANDIKYLTNALPHEITHVLLADCLDGQRIPPWADEGMAVLAESEDQQARHLATVETQRGAGRIYRLADLLALTTCPPERDRSIFYGQSLSVMRFLAARKPPETVVPFLRTAMSRGYDDALRAHYGINGIGDLERQWLASLVKSEAQRPTLPR